MDSKELQEAYMPKTLEDDDAVAAIYPRSQYHKVRQWHKAFSLPVGDTPNTLDADRRELRLKLIEEEFDEFMEALYDGNIEEAAKELGDLSWVVQGAAVEMGLDLDRIIARIYKSNMSKLGADGKPIYREDGKVLKGPDYVETDLEGLV